MPGHSPCWEAIIAWLGPAVAVRAVASRNCSPLGVKRVLPFLPTHLNKGEVELVERVSSMCARL